MNLVTKLWQHLDANFTLSNSFLEYIKLSQIVVIYVMSFVEDRRAFSLVAFLKDKLYNRLDGDHLGLVVGTHNQSVYILKSFLYNDYFKQWLKSCKFHRINTMM